jgi:hypothetical protein
MMLASEGGHASHVVCSREVCSLPTYALDLARDAVERADRLIEPGRERLEAERLPGLERACPRRWAEPSGLPMLMLTTLSPSRPAESMKASESPRMRLR